MQLAVGPWKVPHVLELCFLLSDDSCQAPGLSGRPGLMNSFQKSAADVFMRDGPWPRSVRRRSPCEEAGPTGFYHFREHVLCFELHLPCLKGCRELQALPE